MTKKTVKAPKIEFVSYDGEYPMLCHGNLVLKINGKKFEFDDTHYPKFWSSGGEVSFDDDWNEEVTQDEWYWRCFEENKLPKIILDNKELIMEIFNENVPFGCCGGCV